MKSKLLFILLGIATLVTVAGALLKVEHLPGGDFLLAFGMFFQFGTILFAVYKSSKNP